MLSTNIFLFSTGDRIVPQYIIAPRGSLVQNLSSGVKRQVYPPASCCSEFKGSETEATFFDTEDSLY